MKLTSEMCQFQFDSLTLDQKRWLCTIIQEYHHAKEKHPDWSNDLIHRAAIVAEECGELVQAALQHHYEGGQYYLMHKEAIQTAATCLRFLIEAPELKRPSERSTKHMEG